MKKKNLFSKLMACLTNLIITLLPILVWDIIILLILAGFVSGSVMTFLDDVIYYVIIASFCLTNSLIALTRGQTYGHSAFGLKIIDLKGKKAKRHQVALREFLGAGVFVVGLFYFVGIVGVLAYLGINCLVALIDKEGRILVDFICHTKTVRVEIQKKEEDDDVKVMEFSKASSEVQVEEVSNPNAYRYDLHMHSKHSVDGCYTVEEIFQQAKANGIEVISITDHNCVKANYEARVLAQPYGIRYISGIEIDCTFEGLNLHILGYGIDSEDSRYTQLENAQLKQMRKISMDRVTKFKEVTGIDLNVERLVSLSTSGIITGENIAREVLHNPLYSDFEFLQPYREGNARSDNPYFNFYRDFFAEGKPCYIDEEFPSLEKVVELIHSTGGLAVLAHPKKPFGDNVDQISRVVAAGVDGLEVFTSYHDETDIELFLQVARDSECFVTCGSDYHGELKPGLLMGDTHATSRFDKLISVFINRCLAKEENNESIG